MRNSDNIISIDRQTTEFGEVLRVIDNNVPAVLAHRLAYWSKDASGLLTMTFAEERAQLSEPERLTLTVCARVAIPTAALPEMIRFLESALSAHAINATAPTTRN